MHGASSVLAPCLRVSVVFFFSPIQIPRRLQASEIRMSQKKRNPFGFLSTSVTFVARAPVLDRGDTSPSRRPAAILVDGGKRKGRAMEQELAAPGFSPTYPQEIPMDADPLRVTPRGPPGRAAAEAHPRSRPATDTL